MNLVSSSPPITSRNTCVAQPMIIAQLCSVFCLPAGNWSRVLPGIEFRELSRLEVIHLMNIMDLFNPSGRLYCCVSYKGWELHSNLWESGITVRRQRGHLNRLTLPLHLHRGRHRYCCQRRWCIRARQTQRQLRVPSKL